MRNYKSLRQLDFQNALGDVFDFAEFWEGVVRPRARSNCISAQTSSCRSPERSDEAGPVLGWTVLSCRVQTVEGFICIKQSGTCSRAKVECLLFAPARTLQIDCLASNCRRQRITKFSALLRVVGQNVPASCADFSLFESVLARTRHIPWVLFRVTIQPNAHIDTFVHHCGWNGVLPRTWYFIAVLLQEGSESYLAPAGTEAESLMLSFIHVEAALNGVVVGRWWSRLVKQTRLVADTEAARPPTPHVLDFVCQIVAASHKPYLFGDRSGKNLLFLVNGHTFFVMEVLSGWWM